MKRKRGWAKKINASILMGRPINAIMVFLAVIIGGLLGGLHYKEVILPAISAALISMGAQAVNDFFDVEIDKRRGKKRPLVEGILTLKEARVVWILYFVTGLFLAILSSIYHFILAFLAATLSYLYSRYIQAKKYIGNLVVSLLVALSVVYGSLGGHVENTILPAIIIFLVNWGREIYKDIVDGEADYPKKVSLYHILTRDWAGFLASYLIFLGVILTPFPFLFKNLNYLYVPFIIITDLIALYGITKAIKKDYHRAERYIKVGMITALIAFLLGAIG